MQEYKSRDEDFVTFGVLKRLMMLKWWFLLLLIAGLLALIYIFVFEVPTQLQPISKPQSGLSQPNAYYTFASLRQTQGQPTGDLRPYIMVGIFAVLAVVLISSLAVQLLSKDTDKVKAAGDLVKTCIGFFIGVATSYVGK